MIILFDFILFYSSIAAFLIKSLLSNTNTIEPPNATKMTISVAGLLLL